ANVARIRTILVPDRIPDVVLRAAASTCDSGAAGRHGPAGLRVDRFQPGFLPEDQAGRLTSAIGRAVAAQIEMNRIGNAATAGAIDGVAGLVRALEHLEALPAIAEHLRHERQPFEAPLPV